jgi:hypothetical protein
MNYNGTSYIAKINVACNRTFNYIINVVDMASNTIEVSNSSLRSYWGPVILEIKIEQGSDNELIFSANVTDWGSGVEEVLLEFEFSSYDASGGLAASIQANTTRMEFNGSLYVATLSFFEEGILTWRIIVRDSLNQFFQSLSSEEPYYFNLPAEMFNWDDLVPLLVVAGGVPVILITFVSLVRKRRRNLILTKKRQQREILDRSSDIFSLRAVICRNNYGITLYKENFVGRGQDEDMIAGLTTAVTDMVADMSQRAIEQGDFDTLEREGFNVLSYHGNYITISVISEQKMSSFMKTKMIELTNQIERWFSKEDLEDPVVSSDLKKQIMDLVYEILPVGFLMPLTVDFQLLKKKKKTIKKEDRKLLGYLSEVPSFVDGKLVFHAMTFLTSFTVHGISLVKAFCIFEDLYNLGVIRNLTDTEISFVNPSAPVSEA